MNKPADQGITSQCFVLKRSLTNNQELVHVVLDEICRWMRKVSTPEGKITDVQIVLAEALNNIIEHGYECENTGTVEIVLKVSKDRIWVQLIDNGVEFTPPAVSETPLKDIGDTDSLPEGGFGWFLIKSITSSYEFYRKPDRNVLCLSFD